MRHYRPVETVDGVGDLVRCIAAVFHVGPDAMTPSCGLSIADRGESLPQIRCSAARKGGSVTEIAAFIV